MRPVPCSLVVVVAVAGLAAGPVRAAPLPDKLVAAYAGDYASECDNPAAMRARVSKEGLMVLRAGKSVTGVFEAESRTHAGQPPPAQFETALVAKAAPGGESIVFVIYRFASGPAVQLDVDPAVLRRVGSSPRATIKYKRC